MLLRGLREFREHLGGELTITLLEDLGRGVEVHVMDDALILQAHRVAAACTTAIAEHRRLREERSRLVRPTAELIATPLVCRDGPIRFDTWSRKTHGCCCQRASLKLRRGSIAPRRYDHVQPRAAVSEQCRAQLLAPPDVEEAFPPPRQHHLRDQHCDGPARRVGVELFHVAEQRAVDLAKGSGQEHETRRHEATRAAMRRRDLVVPSPAEGVPVVLGLGALEPEQVDRDDVGRQRHRELQRAIAHPAAPFERHQDRGRFGFVEHEGAGDGMPPIELRVIAMDGEQEPDGGRDGQHDDPGAFRELSPRTITARAAIVVPAPTALIARRPRDPRARLRCQCTTMLTWLVAKVRKAPIAKSGISRSVIPPNTTRSRPATSVRNAMPIEKTRRRSASAKLRGRNPSSATIRHRRGKPT